MPSAIKKKTPPKKRPKEALGLHVFIRKSQIFNTEERIKAFVLILIYHEL